MQFGRGSRNDCRTTPVGEEELATFEEAGACGTAAVISPISYIDDSETGKRYSFGDTPGPWSTKYITNYVEYNTEPSQMYTDGPQLL